MISSRSQEIGIPNLLQFGTSILELWANEYINPRFQLYLKICVGGASSMKVNTVLAGSGVTKVLYFELTHLEYFLCF